MLRDVSGGPVGGSLPSELMPCCSPADVGVGGYGGGRAGGEERSLALFIKTILPFFEVHWGKWQVRKIWH